MNSQEISIEERKRRATRRRLDAHDWDFATEQSESPFSALHWHPCRFPSQVPATAISRLTNKSEIVLDPFMGSATTLVEAQRLGRRSIGVDINPISVLMAQSKVLNRETADILEYIERLLTRTQTQWPRLEPAEVPEPVQRDKWFAPSTLSELRKLWGLIDLDNSEFSDIGKSAFSSVLISCCKETRHWGYICDNSTPKTDRIGEAKETFIKSLRLYKAAYASRQTWPNQAIEPANVIQGDSKSVLEQVDGGAIDLVVTSPPYFGVADYVKAQRLSMEWLSLEIEPVRKAEIGARSKRHRKTAASDFLHELELVFAQCHRTLKPGGYAVIVFGSSPARQDMLPGFLDGLQNIGFDIESNILRNISSMRRQFPSLSTERVAILRKQ